MIVVGAGFAGLAAVKELANQRVDVVWIDRNNYHLFQPLLYQVATGALNPETIAWPLRTRAKKWRNVHVVLADVTEIDLNARILHTLSEKFSYDYLILATGTVTNFFGNQELAEKAYDLKGLNLSLELRSAILSSIEKYAARSRQEVQPPLEYAIVGAGPTGVEVAGALVDLVRIQLRKSYPEVDLSQTRIHLLQSGDVILPTLPADVQAAAFAALQMQGIEIKLNSHVEHFDGHTIKLSNGGTLRVDLLIWTAGVSVPPLIAALAIDKGPGGRVKVTSNLYLSKYPEVFVLGDLAYCPGQNWPGNAPFARDSGIFAGRFIREHINGRRKFGDFAYRDRGTMVALRPFSAIVYVIRPYFFLQGIVGWLIWLVFHIGALSGFRNRLGAILDWGTDIIARRAAAALIFPFTNHKK